MNDATKTGGHELRYLARKFGLTTAEAVRVKREAGGSKQRENELAAQLMRGQP